MKSGPDIAMIASLVGDPARANMLTALMNGRALTASELAQEAGITPQTASSHLSKLEAGGLIEPEKQGRHRYYRLTDDDVAGVLEGLAGLAARTGHMRVRTGPKDPALRRARICYDHLAGDLGVQMLDTLRAQNLVRQKKQEIELTAEGERFLAKHLQISPDMLAHPRRPVCKACLDWSERRHHLAGTLGARHDAAFRRAEMGCPRRHARQPRGEFYAHRREAVCRVVRDCEGLNTSACKRLSSSWPGLTRPSTSLVQFAWHHVDARAFASPKRLRPRRRAKPGHDGECVS
ncbi:DNA-binding transcriptional ArsR family regulator [Bradyrhizobium sp. GM2.4]